MSDRTPASKETDPRFRTGAWIGLWTQPAVMDWARLTIHFQAGVISGTGRDGHGAFALMGSYSIKDGSITLKKKYEGAYEVTQTGAAYEIGMSGRWRNSQTGATGIWHIWPADMDNRNNIRLEIPSIKGPEIEIDLPEEDGDAGDES